MVTRTIFRDRYALYKCRETNEWEPLATYWLLLSYGDIRRYVRDPYNLSIRRNLLPRSSPQIKLKTDTPEVDRLR